MDTQTASSSEDTPKFSLGQIVATPNALNVWFMPDGDPAGERFATNDLRLVSLHRFTRRVKLKENQQPTDLSAEQMKTCFKC